MSQRVERELALFKVSAPPGAARTEVVQLADMFRARIVDVSGELQMLQCLCNHTACNDRYIAQACAATVQALNSYMLNLNCCVILQSKQ